MMKDERRSHLRAVGLTFVRIILPRLGFKHFGPTAGNATVGLAIPVKKTSPFGLLRTNSRARVQIGLDFLRLKRQTSFALGTPLLFELYQANVKTLRQHRCRELDLPGSNERVF